MIRLVECIDKFNFVPVFGSGESLQQPVYVKDLAWSIVEVLKKTDTYKEDYNISGKYPETFVEIINQVSEKLNKKVFFIKLPYRLFVYIFRFLEVMKIKLPIKSEQIET